MSLVAPKRSTLNCDCSAAICGSPFELWLHVCLKWLGSEEYQKHSVTTRVVFDSLRWFCTECWTSLWQKVENV